jgi:hypothetical protein
MSNLPNRECRSDKAHSQAVLYPLDQYAVDIAYMPGEAISNDQRSSIRPVLRTRLNARHNAYL